MAGACVYGADSSSNSQKPPRVIFMKGELGVALRAGWLAGGVYGVIGNADDPKPEPLKVLFNVGAGMVAFGLGASKKLRFT